MKKDECQELPINQRFALTMKEASLYFHIGEKKLRRMAVEHSGAAFLVCNGRKVLIIREEFEQFLRHTSCI